MDVFLDVLFMPHCLHLFFFAKLRTTNFNRTNNCFIDFDTARNCRKIHLASVKNIFRHRRLYEIINIIEVIGTKPRMWLKINTKLMSPRCFAPDYKSHEYYKPPCRGGTIVRVFPNKKNTECVKNAKLRNLATFQR